MSLFGTKRLSTSTFWKNKRF